MDFDLFAGDTMRFTLQPSFASIDRGSFLCHLRYRSPKRLYTISYRVAIVRHGVPVWISNRVSKTMLSSDLKSHTDMATRVGVLQTKHMTFLKLEEDLILRGQEVVIDKNKQFSFHLHEFKTLAEFNRSRIRAHSVFKKLMYADLQVRTKERKGKEREKEIASSSSSFLRSFVPSTCPRPAGSITGAT